MAFFGIVVVAKSKSEHAESQRNKMIAQWQWPAGGKEDVANKKTRERRKTLSLVKKPDDSPLSGSGKVCLRDALLTLRELEFCPGAFLAVFLSLFDPRVTG